jgi:hypothetical protein
MATSTVSCARVDSHTRPHRNASATCLRRALGDSGRSASRVSRVPYERRLRSRAHVCHPYLRTPSLLHLLGRWHLPLRSRSRVRVRRPHVPELLHGSDERSRSDGSRRRDDSVRAVRLALSRPNSGTSEFDASDAASQGNAPAGGYGAPVRCSIALPANRRAPRLRDQPDQPTKLLEGRSAYTIDDRDRDTRGQPSKKMPGLPWA